MTKRRKKDPEYTAPARVPLWRADMPDGRVFYLYGALETVQAAVTEIAPDVAVKAVGYFDNARCLIVEYPAEETPVGWDHAVNCPIYERGACTCL